MSLPKRIKEEDLQSFGYCYVGDEKVKHIQYNSWRYKCRVCGDWCIQSIISNNVFRVCRSCFKRGRWVKCNAQTESNVDLDGGQNG